MGRSQRGGNLSRRRTPRLVPAGRSCAGDIWCSRRPWPKLCRYQVCTLKGGDRGTAGLEAVPTQPYISAHKGEVKLQQYIQAYTVYYTKLNFKHLIKIPVKKKKMQMINRFSP